MEATIRTELRKSRDVLTRLADELAPEIARAATTVVNSYRRGGKLLLAGNGGSAADAQHVAGELVGRFRQERAPLPAIALTTDTSVLTAIANDYSVEDMFRRQVEALGRESDVFIGLSTSGASPNVLAAVTAARQLGLTTIGLTGDYPDSPLARSVDLALCVPSRETPHIQEAHICILHTICGLVERELFGRAQE